MIEAVPVSAKNLCSEFELRMYGYEHARRTQLRRYLIMLLNGSGRALQLADQFDRGELSPEEVLDLA